LPKISEVVVCDGLFLFAKQEVFQKCRFDEKMLKKFHGYDIDFCLQVFSAGYKVVVANHLLIEHFGACGFNAEFYAENSKVMEKWKKQLPVGSCDIQGIWWKKFWRG